MDEFCPVPSLQILQRLSYVPQPCLIEEIEVPIRPASVNQARSRVDKELKVGGLTLSDSAISTRGHASHYISGRFASRDLMCLQMRSQLFLSVENAPLDRSDGDVFRSRDLVIFPLLDKAQGQSLALA
jgi:hypothetical protein